MEIARFMATPAGRGIRIAFGLILIWLGLLMDKPAGYVLEVLGLIPIAAGTLNLCFLGPIFGAPLRGRDVMKR